MNYKYSLDKSSKKHNCPGCGKKRFVRYVNNEHQNYCNIDIGRCDREQECGYHLKPEFNKDVDFVNYSRKAVKSANTTSKLPISLITPTLGLQHLNNLVDFLFKQFEKKKTTKVLSDYKVGTSKKWKGATIFWQIDEKQKVRSGKIIHYNPENGKRIKEPFPRIAWVHKELEKLNTLPKNFELKQCLYGEHLFTHPSYSDKIVAVVESEKTALIMAINYPKYLWLSCGSINGIKTTLFNPIINKRVVLFPDKECFELWAEKAISLNKNGFNLQVSSLIEGLNIAKGLDIADLFNDYIGSILENNTCNKDIATDCNTKVAVSCNKVVAQEKPIYDVNGYPVKMTPELNYLIEKLGLENE